jgi:hypothetical protein
VFSVVEKQPGAASVAFFRIHVKIRIPQPACFIYTMTQKILTVLSLALLAGCTSLNTSQFSQPFHGRVSSDLKADVAVGEKIAGSASSILLFGLITLGAPNKLADGIVYGGAPVGNPYFNPYEELKSAAAYNAVTEARADVIIAPRYTLSGTNYFLFKTLTATVSGYKGTLRGFRTSAN